MANLTPHKNMPHPPFVATLGVGVGVLVVPIFPFFAALCQLTPFWFMGENTTKPSTKTINNKAQTCSELRKPGNRANWGRTAEQKRAAIRPGTNVQTVMAVLWIHQLFANI